MYMIIDGFPTHSKKNTTSLPNLYYFPRTTPRNEHSPKRNTPLHSPLDYQIYTILPEALPAAIRRDQTYSC
uniref:Uncharacterized protein n=1 Tax=Arundo donax TaxID=35708 RepID=A0A0A9CNP0_ARUDO